MDDSQRPFTDEITPTQLAFWMGEINTKVTNLTHMLTQLVDSEASKWEAFSKWRDTVNERLAAGAEKFTSVELELNDQQGQIAELREMFTRHLEIVQPKPKSAEDVLKQFVSWPWLLENLLVPVLRWGIILFLGYIVITAIPIP